MNAVHLAKLKPGFAKTIPGALLLIYGLSALAYLTVISWFSPVLDMFPFRQTQTAISAYWLANGGPLLAYETPVLGYPWSIPFEFPVYQWLVALLAGSSGFSVDQSGRVISIVFFLAAAATLERIVFRLSSDRGVSIACTGAFVASPLAMFWARSVMIESTALFLALAFLCAIIEFHKNQKMWFALAGVFFAICAALVKITTYYGFAVLLAVILVVLLARDFRTPRFRQMLRTSIVAGIIVAISLVFLLLWLRYADILKQQTPLGESLTSANQRGFVYGTLQQRLDIASWRTIIFGRSIGEIMGSVWILLSAACVLAFTASYRRLGLLLLVCYLIPFLTFTKLHYVHNYYQFANFCFLTTIVGLAIGSLARRGPMGVVGGCVFAAGVAVLSWNSLGSHFLPKIAQDQSQGRIISLSRIVRAQTQKDQVLLIFGLDWSSAVPYYATRKAVMVPNWVSLPSLKVLLDPQKAFGNKQLGAVIVCLPNRLAISHQSTYEAIIKKYSYGRKSESVNGCQIYF